MAVVQDISMPRANRYLIPGATYHLTHRCHDREFLLRHAVDRDAYRRILWKTKPRDRVWVFAYCVTSNHMHLLARAEDPACMVTWMQQAEGQFAQRYNRRKGRSGALWDGRYHCTLIGSAQHCERCMTYIELNMVRAGVVRHPSEWPWCSYREWVGLRQRCRLIDTSSALAHFGQQQLAVFREHYENRINESIARMDVVRQPCWTESVAVGDAWFVKQVESHIAWRRRFETAEAEPGMWILREGGHGSGLQAEKGGLESPARH